VQIQWDESYKTGDDKLDEQHKIWITFYNQLDEAMKGKSWQDVRQTKTEVLKKMIEYVDYHFNYEEEFMRSIGYEEVEKHWRIHRNFRDKIYRLFRDHLDGKPVLNRDMMEMIKN
jgi:hemerythrin